MYVADSGLLHGLLDIQTQEHKLIRDLLHIDQHIAAKNLGESWHDLLQIKEESQRLRAPGREPLLATAPPAPGPISPRAKAAATVANFIKVSSSAGSERCLNRGLTLLGDSRAIRSVV